MNDTAGPEGLVPTLLVFGVIPRTLEKLHEFPDRTGKFRVMDTAEKEFLEIVAHQQVQRGI